MDQGQEHPEKHPKRERLAIDGYVLLVEQNWTSKSNNKYFDTILQRAKDEKTRVRIMAMEINKGEFISAKTDDNYDPTSIYIPFWLRNLLL